MPPRTTPQSTRRAVLLWLWYISVSSIRSYTGEHKDFRAIYSTGSYEMTPSELGLTPTACVLATCGYEWSRHLLGWAHDIFHRLISLGVLARLCY